MDRAARTVVALIALVAMSGSAFGASVCELLCAPSAAQASDNASASSTDAATTSCHKPNDAADAVLTGHSQEHSCGEHADLFVTSGVAEAQRVAGRLATSTASLMPAAYAAAIEPGSRTLTQPDSRADIPPPPSHSLVLRI
ncbi:MAG: hypothetical protein GEU99_02870 [Luteitalea sp.]|nr:hypothetical protein [Luteitalea sp.]